MGQRELEIGSKELLDVLSLDILLGSKLDDLENVDGSESRSVSGSHVLVEHLNSVGSRNVSVLLVHVVSAGSGVVSDPDTKVLDLGGGLLGDLVDGDNLTGGLLDLLELGQEVPESRLGNNLVGGEDSHSVELLLGSSLGRQLSANNLVFVESTHCVSIVMITGLLWWRISDDSRSVVSVSPSSVVHPSSFQFTHFFCDAVESRK